MTNTATMTAPNIRNAGTKPANPRKLFVNIPVENLQRSITFFEELGFTFNTQFTDANGTCMLVGEDAYFMLLTREKFESFTTRPTANAHKETGALFSISVESRDAVDALIHTAVANGATESGEPTDHGFMYERGFYDLDGHGWGVFWMDPAVVEG